MAFQQALSGLSVASKELDTIGNNVSNANTVGFKQSRAQFADVFANSLFGVSATAVGIGAQVTSVAQQFTQGNITSTSNPTDLAISGNGFFRMLEPSSGTISGSVSYTRNGEFQIDRNGFVVNGSSQLTGYPATNGVIVPGQPVPLQITTANIGAAPTTSISLIANLDASKLNPTAQTPAGPAFPGLTVPTASPDPASYNWSTQMNVFDSLGVTHSVTLYFVSQNPTTPLNWDVYAQFDGSQFAAAPTPIQTLTFLPDGTMDPTVTTATLDASVLLGSAAGTPLSNGANDPVITLDLTKSTQFAGAFGINQETVDGYANGTLTGISIDPSGVVDARFSNGQTKAVGQVVLVNFANPQGLQNLGGNRWGESFASGSPTVNAPGSGNVGTIQSAALEDSNVDLTSELVNMITAQRFYQANAQAIKTQDQVLQTLLNI